MTLSRYDLLFHRSVNRRKNKLNFLNHPSQCKTKEYSSDVYQNIVEHH